MDSQGEKFPKYGKVVQMLLKLSYYIRLLKKQVIFSSYSYFFFASNKHKECIKFKQEWSDNLLKLLEKKQNLFSTMLEDIGSTYIIIIPIDVLHNMGHIT